MTRLRDVHGSGRAGARLRHITDWPNFRDIGQAPAQAFPFSQLGLAKSGFLPIVLSKYTKLQALISRIGLGLALGILSLNKSLVQLLNRPRFTPKPIPKLVGPESGRGCSGP